MRLTTGSSVRIVALVVLTVFVQFSLVSQLTVGGASAELEPLVVIALALLLGPEIGAIVGFSMGLFADLVLLQTLGISSLVYLALGYWAGRFKELRIRDNDWPRLLPMAAAGVGTFLATAGYAFILYLLGDATLASAVVMREVFLTTLINIVIAIPVFWSIRRLFRPYIRGEERRKRRKRLLSRRRRRKAASVKARVPA